MTTRRVERKANLIVAFVVVFAIAIMYLRHSSTLSELVSRASKAESTTTPQLHSSDGSFRPSRPFDKGREWNVAFHDEFDSNVLGPQWTRCYWWANNADGCTIASNNELQTYKRKNVSVAEGVLKLKARKKRVGTFAYTSGMVTSGPRSSEPTDAAGFAFTYGLVEARIRVPKGAGLWPAVWLLPTTRKSRPEIDILEVDGIDPATASTHIHTDQRDAGKGTVVHDLSDGFHVVSLLWEPGELSWWVDGAQVWTATGQDISSEPMYLIMNLAVGGESVGSPTVDTHFPAIFDIDWIRVWQ